MRLMWLAVIGYLLSGCSVAALKGEIGYEYACRYNPIDAVQTQTAYNRKVFEFGRRAE